ncbi:30S ribosomal protein S12 methylthiotransferase RimO [Francisella adeliensis]|uniref:Ribosomal protein uS12 methylthiotransferase RimO n=1 Tax=Francisella adeliensis TaxID=2007306 RepID=A0A2Z4XWP0_9GAMM|nr:30S ribosomal protein S12 methylthiotransferase RimO [Francisella adeliensis]AXA33129.1 30S ribosomal protein S12 methylthiotransferase RimO [Francisella adeliensis]MBK2085979.1 30S ribosomal protein S12 methylthiotransferase RimO [Francisella adeliensis]MBK2096857.1 30S ribosomal protein S12 methylthiotransferase RimO [Francisella adeliensis]QIW11358.1 30S ribosomal protein S12 methylthiotransferase RimO [Francisella adeliensis]QIW13233.1 30S ribosomal protein S12 methylthiotransferase Rim
MIKIPKIGFVSLGCPKNLVDSERIITKLKAEGYELCDSYNNADMVIVNTCGFLNSAIDESLEVIGEAIAKNGKVLVTGCLGNKADMIKEKHPKVLSITGPQDYENLIEAVHTHAPIFASDFVSLVPPQGIKLTPRHYSYLKISEGCNNTCTFCIIPDIRGKLKSRNIDNIMIEAEKLKNAGVKELLVISQDTSAYGVDIKYNPGIWHDKQYQSNILDLSTALGELDMWTRLHYVYPYPHVDKIVPLMAQGKILPYLDVPLQHSSPEVLKRMKRPAHTQKTLDRINKWRDICPDIAIRSTFIVGFPGETEADFEHLLDFARQAQLDRVGCFKYSEVEGAKANDFDDLISEEVKQQRLDTFMGLQSEISAKKLERFVGTEQQVIIDSINTDENYAIGRTKYDAPEVDGQVIIGDAKERRLKVGEFAIVEITESTEYDLIAD